ncbi:MAG: hypothetical protein DMF08_12545 [Verrucomicrobia bacterium]|nr:MAG: hypothetical protein DMF08_12545 [Verrucomicrobiota bacterium]
MNAAACLTLAAFYCVVWCKQRENWVHLVFSFSAVAAAAIAAFELAMMHAKTVGQYEALLRWIHVPVCLRYVRATLSPRRTTMARVEYLRLTDSGANSQFHFHSKS